MLRAPSRFSNELRSAGTPLRLPVVAMAQWMITGSPEFALAKAIANIDFLAI